MNSLQDEQRQLFDRITNEAPLQNPFSRFEKGLRIYQNAYRIRIEESLREDFEQTESAIGDKAFQLEIDSFLSSPPSRYWNLSELSVAFSQYLLGRFTEPAMKNLVREEIALIYASSIHLPSLAFHFDGIENSLLHLNPSLGLIEKSLKIALRQSDDTALIELKSNEHELLQALLRQGHAIPFSKLLEIAASFPDLSVEVTFKNFVQKQILLGNTPL